MPFRATISVMELNTPLEGNLRLTKGHKEALKRLKLTTVRDLLYYFPTRYHNISEIKKIGHVKQGDLVVIYGKVARIKTRKTFRTRIPMTEATIEDDTGKIGVLWFHQAYVSKMLKEGSMVKLAGKVTEGKSGIYLANPEFEKTKKCAMRIASKTEGVYFPFSIAIIVWRVTPTICASSSCVISFLCRRKETLFDIASFIMLWRIKLTIVYVSL